MSFQKSLLLKDVNILLLVEMQEHTSFANQLTISASWNEVLLCKALSRDDVEEMMDPGFMRSAAIFDPSDPFTSPGHEDWWIWYALLDCYTMSFFVRSEEGQYISILGLHHIHLAVSKWRTTFELWTCACRFAVVRLKDNMFLYRVKFIHPRTRPRGFKLPTAIGVWYHLNKLAWKMKK